MGYHDQQNHSHPTGLWVLVISLAALAALAAYLVGPEALYSLPAGP